MPTFENVPPSVRIVLACIMFGYALCCVCYIIWTYFQE